MRIRNIIALVVLSWLGMASLASSARAEGAAAAPRALLLLKTSSAGGTTANFGRSATEGLMSRALKEPFKKLGIAFVSAKELTPSVGEAEAGLPVSDGSAAEMARQAGASIAVIVGIRAQSQGPIRATPFLSQKASLRLRVIDVVTGDVAFDTRLSAYGYHYHKSEGQGARLAMAKAIARANEKLLPEIRTRWSSAKAKGKALIVTVSGADSWRPLAAILQRLAMTKGVESVHAIEIGRDRVRLAVSSRQSISSLIANLRRTRIYNGTIAVTVSGNAIAISLQMRATTPVNHG